MGKLLKPIGTKLENKNPSACEAQVKTEWEGFQEELAQVLKPHLQKLVQPVITKSKPNYFQSGEKL